MDCLHPLCPMGKGASSWEEVVNHPTLQLNPARKTILRAVLETEFTNGPSSVPIVLSLPKIGNSLLSALLKLCPCLFNQVKTGKGCTPRGVVHLCELTLGERITEANVHKAFLVQHPKKGPPYKFPPVEPCANGGTVMEMLCSEVLTSAEIPAMALDDKGWPIWRMPGHILLNEGKMGGLQAFGDILLPCGPTNLVISVKSEAARERLLYSSNSIEGIGFGFFNQPEEFWSESRMNLYKRMGFSAIYLPDDTHAAINAKLVLGGIQGKAVNVNGTALYRPLTAFTTDMKHVVGKHSLLL